MTNPRSPSKQPNGRAIRTPICLFVPELNALYYSAPPWKVQGTGSTTRFYYFAELQFLIGSVPEVYYHAFEVYRSIVNTNLKLPKPTFRASQ